MMLMLGSDSLGGVWSSIVTGLFPSMRIRVDVGTTNSEGVRGNGGQRTIAAWQRKRRANIKGKAAGARQAGSDGQDSGRDDVKTYRGRGLTAEGGGLSPGSHGVLHCHQRSLSPAAWCRRAKSVPSASDPIYCDIVQGGTALQLMSGAVPLVGGLADFTGDLAPDAVECCKLARTVALRLTDGLPDGPIATSHDAEEKRTPNAAGVGWAAGGSKFGVLTDGVSEEAVMEWFIEEVTNYEPSDRRETAGSRLGKRHLRKILTAVGQDCPQGANDTGAKVSLLVYVVLPEADIRPAETSSAWGGGLVRSPVSVPTHDGNLAELESLKADKEKHSAKLEALKADKEKHYAELEALKA
ncbi:expressed unknown protein [Ectocarpus siliculosus]|uniref:Uncharacterized protein n=1 Tax=Ectocarpus siliculosus TaxID=2880 RepID=D8LGB9_ECTSI|nr:expressed unknown protein [Ectocarpus siliculosus]|eukprot:CBN79018.1 expressed unknown protein [Ectocarpus siliculosus]